MRFGVPRPPRDGEEGIIPLINIVFLLLIFFMVVGRISATDPFKVTPPRSTSEAPAEERELIVLVGADGRLALDGIETVRADFEIRAAERLRTEAGLTVRLKADGKASAREVVSVMEMLRRAGAERLVLFTAQERR